MSHTKNEKDHVGTILVVDDEPTIRNVLGSILSNEGYRMDFAENGHDGYKKARELLPDLIFLDVMMPGMNGFDACRKIRTEPPLAQVPIIIISAVSNDEYRIRSIQSGANDFISKPFDLDELLSKVKKITKDNGFQKLLPEREDLKIAREDLRDTFNKPREEFGLAPELRDTENKGNARRDAGFTSISSISNSSLGETPTNLTEGRKSVPLSWKKLQRKKGESC